MPSSYSTDIVIFGGGVAGLWLLNRLTAEGYQAILLERDRLGGGQSINSQGIIHGGLKFALHGAISGASRATADMPRRWRDCIEGNGEIDLSACRVLSPHFLLWSGAGFGANMKAFLGSKAIAGKTEPAAPDEIPEILRGCGAVYRLPDFVVDAESLIEALARPHRDSIVSIAMPDSVESTEFAHSTDSRESRCASDSAVAGAAERIAFRCSANHRELILRADGEAVTIKARRYIFCAGEGNASLIEQAGLPLPRCQTRPLKMVSVTGDSLPPVFLHVLGEGFSATPRLTVTSHHDANGQPVWYLGGQLAEEGTNRSDAAQIDAAKRELAELLPEVYLNDLRWRCLDINRAEPASPGGRRPDNAAISAEQDIIVAWPTKLTLAPALADLVMQSLLDDGIAPGAGAKPDRRADAVSLPGNSASRDHAAPASAPHSPGMPLESIGAMTVDRDSKRLPSILPGPPPSARPFWY